MRRDIRTLGVKIVSLIPLVAFQNLTIVYRDSEWIGKIVGGLALRLPPVLAMRDFDELTIAELETREAAALRAPCTNCDSGLRQCGADIARFSPKRLL